MKLKNVLKYIILFSMINFFLSCGEKKVSMDEITFTKISSKNNNKIQGYNNSDIGYVIYDLKKSEIIDHHNLNRSFIPASVSKLFTSVYALKILGEDKRFSTELKITGDVTNGILNGNLFLKGEGDPTLMVPDLLRMVLKLKDKGIIKITGKFYYDNSFIRSKEMISNNMPENAYYNSGYGSLNLNLNRILFLKNRDRLYSLPSVKNIKFNISQETTDEYREVKFSQSGIFEKWTYPEKRIRNNHILPVKNTSLFTAMVFQKLCSIQGIVLSYPSEKKSPDEGDIIYTNKSSNLIDIISGLLIYSNNLKAEILGTIASSKDDNKLSINQFFNKQFSGINWKGFNLINYSGLTSHNRCTPIQALAILTYLEKSRPSGRELENMLPMSGSSGTLRKRFTEPEYSYRIFGKTGTIFYASALSGIFYGKSGKKYLFSVFINDKAKRQEYDSLKVQDLHELNKARKWSRSAENKIDHFIKERIKRL